MIDLDKLEELEKAATPGPWVYYDNGFDGGVVSGLKNEPREWLRDYDTMIFGGEPCEGRVEGDDPDVKLIISMRNALPELIAELNAARRIIDLVRMMRREEPEFAEKWWEFETSLAVYDETIDRRGI